MNRIEIAPGAFVTEVPGDKFKRCKIAVHLVAPGRRAGATELAVLPHVLDRRYAEVPDAMALSRLLYSLYGADLSSESYTAGPYRVVALSLSGLKNEYALAGEDLAARYLDILCGLLFSPVLESGAFAATDVAIERDKQRDFLKSEMNDKRGYCLRQARRKLYGASPLGIESPGYLEDIDGLTPAGLYGAYGVLLAEAQLEVFVCGIPAEKAAEPLRRALAQVNRKPAALPVVPPLAKPAEFAHFAEAMPTTQGKLAIMCASGTRANEKGEAVMRLASALYGGLPTSRLFMNVREKQSLCYYCAASYGYFGGVLTVDSGVDHKNAQKAADAILKELEEMQRNPVSAEELQNAKSYLKSVFTSAKDSPDALMNFAFTEWLKGTNRTLDEMTALTNAVTADEIQNALAGYAPALEYVITDKTAKGEG